MKGKLIVIDGTDGSGKQTQTQLLYQRLLREGKKVHKVTFPDYDSPYSCFVKAYLNGEFGKEATDVSPYIASTFYALDRYASFKTKWEKFYNEGAIILCDRYITSNMIHQAAKLTDEEKPKYLEWLLDLEYNIYKLPKPDLVFFLSMPPEFSQKLIEHRKNKITNDKIKDIHESNIRFLKNSYENALNIAQTYGWETIPCVRNNKLLSIEEIHEAIYKKLAALI